MQGRSPARYSDCVFYPYQLRKLLLKTSDFRPHRKPPALQDAYHSRFFLRAVIRLGERDSPFRQGRRPPFVRRRALEPARNRQAVRYRAIDNQLEMRILARLAREGVRPGRENRDSGRALCV